MAQEDRNRLVEWYEILCKQRLVVRQVIVDWWGAAKEEPRLIWETPAVRYLTYGVCGLILVWGTAWLATSIAPPPPPDAKAPAVSADFHVVCSDTTCSHHFVVHRKLGFRKFPVACPKCKEKTGSKAHRCNSNECRGGWVAPSDVDGVATCPLCAEPLH